MRGVCRNSPRDFYPEGDKELFAHDFCELLRSLELCIREVEVDYRASLCVICPGQIRILGCRNRCGVFVLGTPQGLDCGVRVHLG